MNKDLRKLIIEDIQNDTSNNFEEVKKYNDLNVPDQVLQTIYLSKDIPDKIDYHSLSKLIYDDLLIRLKGITNDDDIFEPIKEITDIFYEYCDNDRKDFYLRYFLNSLKQEQKIYSTALKCEGRLIKDAHVLSWNKIYSDGSEYLSESVFFSKERIRCIRCQKYKIKLKKDELFCYNCKTTYNQKQKFHYEIKDIFWCLGANCSTPQKFNDSLDSINPETLTLNHIIKKSDPISRFSGWMNRLLIFIPRCFCEKCKKVLKPKINAKNQRPGYYAATIFYCDDSSCSEKNKNIYLNHCANGKCHGVIDTRICTKQCPTGFHICTNCNACCTQEILDRRGGKNKEGHVYNIYIPEDKYLNIKQDEMYCYNCSDKLVLSNYEKRSSMYCSSCWNEIPIKSIKCPDCDKNPMISHYNDNELYCVDCKKKIQVKCKNNFCKKNPMLKGGAKHRNLYCFGCKKEYPLKKDHRFWQQWKELQKELDKKFNSTQNKRTAEGPVN